MKKYLGLPIGLLFVLAIVFSVNTQAVKAEDSATSVDTTANTGVGATLPLRQRNLRYLSKKL